MYVMVITLETSHLEMSLLNDEARPNIRHMLVTLDTSHLEISPLNDDALENMDRMVVTLDTSHLETSPLNDAAEAKIDSMLVTLDTSHLEMSPLILFAPGITSLLNNWPILVTADTSQDPIGPCEPLKQSVDSCRHSLMADWSSALDSGAQPAMG